VPLTVFMVGLMFSSLRAVDHDSGKPWAATSTFFRQAARDLAHLARGAFLVMLVLGIVFALLHGAGRGLGELIQTVSKTRLTPSWPAAQEGEFADKRSKRHQRRMNKENRRPFRKRRLVVP
ncbi:MAG: hypothetical protein ACYCSH_07550, partial [Acidithiobacillus sp.]